jgi:hypothetical protein
MAFLPRFNRLTGLNWQRHLPREPWSHAELLRQETDIGSLLAGSRPVCIGKIGTTELCGLEYFDRWIRLPWPRSASWHRPAQRLHHTAGLFPIRKDVFFRWAAEYRESIAFLDVTAQWQDPKDHLGAYENVFLAKNLPSVRRVYLAALRVRFVSWLPQLCSRRWLVISPFRRTIESQLPHLNRLDLYRNVEPSVVDRAAANCQILACPQLAYMVPPVHRDWHEGLADLKRQMEATDFEVAVIGAGAWSIPLAAHAKKMGKIGLHLGGDTQLLFGIKGGRWRDIKDFNDFWVHPLVGDRPENFRLMEGGAYW